jgi:aromatic ring-opening dioxygenase catalytic subunit (LigB family)
MRMPTVYVPHGGGPWPFVEVGLGSRTEQAALATYLRDLAKLPGERPKALLVISAHWEERVPTVMTSAAPPMLYDYYGFPPASYEITWPAPGHPELAARVRALLESAGFETDEDPERGYDHGTFVPLKLTYPAADIRVCQLSLVRGLDPATHLAIGRALAPLRDAGVFIIGSGLSYHNLRAFGPEARPVSVAFDTWLRETTQKPQAERDKALLDWARAPAARLAHPREEHLLPLMVCAGAAGKDAGTITYSGTLLDLQISAHQFG